MSTEQHDAVGSKFEFVTFCQQLADANPYSGDQSIEIKRADLGRSSTRLSISG